MKFIILGFIILLAVVSFLIINIDDQSNNYDVNDNPDMYSYEIHVAEQ